MAPGNGRTEAAGETRHVLVFHAAPCLDNVPKERIRSRSDGETSGIG